MALKSSVFKQKIRKKGHFNYKDLYSFAFDWFKDNGYSVSENGYVEKIGSGGKDITIDWAARKKVTDYFKNVISVKFVVGGMKEEVVERDGKKEDTNKGDIFIEVKGTLEKDYEDRWEKEPMWKFMRGTYEKYIIRTTVDEYEDAVASDCSEFVEQLKSFLEIGGR